MEVGGRKEEEKWPTEDERMTEWVWMWRWREYHKNERGNGREDSKWRKK